MIRIWTERYQPVPLSIAGPGAGAKPTAAGLVTDIGKAAQCLIRRGQTTQDTGNKE
ncbi:MAG: hypothetical protein ACRESE_05690 [Gammaproteobacteria bacterium]